MPLAINDEHAALADVVGSFASTQGLRAFTRAVLDQPVGTGPADPGASWTAMAELGWPGLHLPEEYGGSGFGLLELAIVAEGLGHAVASGPFLSTVVASTVVAEVGSDEQRTRLLPGLADGSVRASLAPLGNGRGASGPAFGGVWAHLHLIAVGEDVLVVGADTVTAEPLPGLDPALGLVQFTLDPAAGGPAEVLAGGASVARRVLRTLAAAAAAGGARATLDVAVDYAKVRQQFGRTIGSFQAVKHHLADMLVRAELAVAAAWGAARESAAGPEAELAAAVAATVALAAYQRNARMNIQIHGGIGFTWEHDAHLHLRRATALSGLLDAPQPVTADVHGRSAQGVRLRQAVDLPPEAEQYRRDAVVFVERLRTAAPADRRALLVESGYLVPHWRKPWGRAAGPAEQLVIEQEFAEVAVPDLGIGGWVLLTLTQTGSAEQIDRWTRASLLGELTWCQLFSEPNAGSDAAAVQTRGVREPGGWRVTGQKVWTSNARSCNRGLATIRTDPDVPKHRGITTMAIDLTAPGVTIRPLREITGDALFNEVFFDDVFVPDEDVVGAVGEGWSVARTTLGNERVSIGGTARRGISAIDLVELLAVHLPGDTGLAREVGELIAEELAMQLVNLRQVERAVSGADPSVEGNVTKVLSAEHGQRVTELAMRIAGPAGVTGVEPRLAHEYLFNRAMTIAGGTSEVSRNVIAERILGLPREIIPR